jgi:hypothetical protein
MTPEEAREILGRFMQEKVSTTQAEAEEAYIQTLVQLELIGRPSRGEGEPDAEYLRTSQRRHRLSELHATLTSADHGGPATPEGAEEEHRAIIEEIEQEARLKLATEGLPEEWRPE